jgi:hypothetical protein
MAKKRKPAKRALGKPSPYVGQKGIKDGRWTREYHEQFAIEAIQSAAHETRFERAGVRVKHPGAGQCAPSTAYAVIRANRDIANARVHLSAIGPASSRRTSRLWAQLSKIERKVEQASNYVAKCMGSDR